MTASKPTFQQVIQTLQNFWGEHGCVLLQPYDLEVRLYEASGRTTTRRISVTPTCGDDEWCRCQCDADYVNGGDCNVDPDGGVIGCGDGVDAGVDAAP